MMSRNLVYTIPKEGAILWIDCIAIPKGAPQNAHKLINFLLRPDIAARVTNHTKIPTLMNKAKAFVDQDILNDPNYLSPFLFDGKIVIEKLDLFLKNSIER
jgi:spermidine/putrescine-binding protein